MRLITRTTLPPEHQNSPISLHAQWYTWSDQARSMLQTLQGKINEGQPPPLVMLPKLGEYGLTYEVSHKAIASLSLCNELALLARAFYECALPKEGIALLTGLFDQTTGPLAIRFLFASLGPGLRRISESASAINPPIQPADRLGSAFALHADLFKETILMSIFDNVPEDDSGASVFMPVKTLECLLWRLTSMPRDVKLRIISLLRQRGVKDEFDVCFNLLHNPIHSWNSELQMRMLEQRIRIKLRRGQGYILDDTEWLHGRERQSTPVSVNRMYRVVFNTPFSEPIPHIRNGDANREDSYD